MSKKPTSATASSEITINALKSVLMDAGLSEAHAQRTAENTWNDVGSVANTKVTKMSKEESAYEWLKQNVHGKSDVHALVVGILEYTPVLLKDDNYDLPFACFNYDGYRKTLKGSKQHTGDMCRNLEAFQYAASLFYSTAANSKERSTQVVYNGPCDVCTALEEQGSDHGYAPDIRLPSWFALDFNAKVAKYLRDNFAHMILKHAPEYIRSKTLRVRIEKTYKIKFTESEIEDEPGFDD